MRFETAGRPAPRGSSSSRERAAPALLLLAALTAASLPAAAELPRHPALTQGPAAPWVVVEDADPTTLAAPEGAAALAYRLVDDQILVAGDASASYFQQWVEVLSPRGLEEAAQWEVRFDPQFQRLVVHGLEVFRQGAWHDRLGSARASLLQREAELERRIFDDSLTLSLVMEDVRVGDVVRIAYTVEGFNPVFGGRFGGSFLLAWSVPVGESRLRLLTPEGSQLFYRLHATELEPRRRRVGAHRELSWRQSGVPAAELEGWVPPEWTPLPFVQVSQFASWREVAEWGAALYAPEPAPGALRQVAEAIRRDHPDDSEERFVAAVRWVEDEVRYFAVTMGPHSHAPHGVGEALRRRYGDCKDKSRLLVALLAELDIEAWPALVDATARGGVAAWHPSPLAFDHVVVVARPAPGGPPVWIDATSTLQGGEAWNLYIPPYEKGLELRSGVEGLSGLPADQSRPGLTVVRYDYRVTGVGEPPEVRVATFFERSHAERQRRRLAATPPERLQEEYVDFYGDGARRVEPLAPLEISDDRRHNLLSITERYRIEGCWSGTDERACDLLPLTLTADLAEPAGNGRRAPLDLPRGLHNREIISLAAPLGWQLEEVQESESNPWFHFTVESSKQGRGIEITYELKTLSRQVDPGDLDDYLAAVRKMKAALGYTLTGAGAAAAPAADPMQPLYAALGCGVLLLGFAVGMAALAGLVYFLVRRRRQRRREELAPPTCPHCGTMPPAGARYCAACGQTLAVPRPGGADAAAMVAIAALAGVGVIALLGFVAAIFIPNFIDALGKGRQKRTLSDLHQLAAAVEVHAGESGSYPEALTADDLVAVLAAAGAGGDLPTRDAWDHPYRYACWKRQEDARGCDAFRVASAGADGVFEHQELADYRDATLAAGALDRDLVVGSEGLVQGPD